jgi:hypothetical protein
MMQRAKWSIRIIAQEHKAPSAFWGVVPLERRGEILTVTGIAARDIRSVGKGSRAKPHDFSPDAFLAALAPGTQERKAKQT